MKTIVIYCEGKAGSHDKTVLEKLLPRPDILIQPVGSKLGAARAIEVLGQRVVKADAHVFFRDRDFDRPLPDTCRLDWDKHTAYAYRITIENYLFDVQVFHDFAKSEGQVALLKAHPDLGTPDGVRQLFIAAARDILDLQIVRHSMGALRKPTDFGTHPEDKGESGKLPKDLSYKALRAQALARIAASAANARDWTPEGFDKIAAAFRARFDEAFFQDLGFLAHFQGKDFAKALARRLPAVLSVENYYRYAKAHFDYQRHPDLVELRQHIETLLRES